MIRAVLFTIALGVILPTGAVAQDEQSSDAAKELKSLQAEYTEASQAFSKAYSAAKTDEERSKIIAEIYPAPKFAPQFFAFAEKYPGTEEALTALTSAMQYAQDLELRDKATEVILKDHIESKGLMNVLSFWMYDNSKQDAIQKVLDENPHKEVKGVATYVLAKQTMRSAGNNEAAQQKATELFKQVASDYGDVEMRGRTLKEIAGADLFEATRLQIGMEAPDIEGQDIDGVNFKLSDYRGQVVVLDFWGDW